MDYFVDYAIAQNALDAIIIDCQTQSAFEYGHIPKAINVEKDSVVSFVKSLNKNKNIFIYGKNDEDCLHVVKNLVESGYDVKIIKNGYKGFILNFLQQSDITSNALNVEESIRKKFHKTIFSKFTKAIKDYNLLQPGDRVAVCISGGKDSMLMAKCFQELKKHNKFDFDLVFLVMDPGYSEQNLQIIKKNALLLGIPITIFNTDIFDSVQNVTKSPCYLCARMRRGCLYNKAKELGCNKIALGHHYDDVIETILMGMLYGAQIQTMMPKVRSDNFEGMELIRPLYLVREHDIKRWREYNNLYFIQCACKFTEKYNSEDFNIEASSARKKIKALIAKLKEDDPQVEANIFKSVENVNLATVICYKDKNGQKHNFLEDY